MKNHGNQTLEKFSSDELTKLDNVKGGQAGITFVGGSFSLTLGSDADGCECDDTEEEEEDPVPKFG